MLVESLMTTDVVTVRGDGTLRDAAERLLDEEVGSVIVVDGDGNPSGIVTETDLLRATYKTDAPLSEIPVAKLSHRPLVTTKPSATVQYVAHRMAKEGVKKVPVMDDLDLVGIITMTDIVWHLSDIRKEASALDAAHKEWAPDG